MDYEDAIGLPLQYYFPDYDSAIIISTSQQNNYWSHRREYARNDLCVKCGIKLIRVMSEDDFDFYNCICVKKHGKGDDVNARAIARALELALSISINNVEEVMNLLWDKYKNDAIAT